MLKSYFLPEVSKSLVLGRRQGYFILNTMNQEMNFLANILSPFKRTLVIRQRIYSLAGENEIALGRRESQDFNF